jgi:16S rRNA (adenine1518-N6/adenine1519-N6)-dimethyltransferase
MPGQRLGQNFLVDEGWRAKIENLLPLRWSDTWIEIGAGRGEITARIAKHVKHVIAVELDSNLAASLKRNTAACENVEVIQRDILTVPFPELFAKITTPIRIYGSIPYYITSPILHLLFENAARIESAHLIVQLEVAVRVASAPAKSEYGYLSVAAQAFSRPAIRMKIPPGAFRPQPKVASAFLELKFPGPAEELGLGRDASEPVGKVFLEFVHACFGQKRKTLANNLRNYFTHGKPYGLQGRKVMEQIAPLLEAASIEPEARAEELSVEQFAALFKAAAAIEPANEASADQ